jgi:hypothetical protein
LPTAPQATAFHQELSFVESGQGAAQDQSQALLKKITAVDHGVNFPS